MRCQAAGWSPMLRLLTPLILALGVLVAPVECTVVHGPHSIFGDPAALATLVDGSSPVHAHHVAATHSTHHDDPQRDPAARRSEPNPAPDDPSADVPTLAPLTAPGEAVALVAIADIGDPLGIVAAEIPPTPEPASLVAQTTPALEPPPPRHLLV